MKKYILALSAIAVLCFAGVAAAEPVYINVTSDQGIVNLASRGATWRCRKCGRVVHSGNTKYPGSGFYCMQDGGTCIFDRVG
jgi:hypothetical protein